MAESPFRTYRTIISVLAIMLLIALLAIAYLWWAYLLLGRENTVYAPGYSSEAFLQLSCSDTKSSVLKALGRPLSVVLYSSSGGRTGVLFQKEVDKLSDAELINLADDGSTYWIYSTQGDATASYKLASVGFMPDGRVERHQIESMVD